MSNFNDELNEKIKEYIKKINYYSSINNKKEEIKYLTKLSNLYFNNNELEKAKINLEKIIKINPNLTNIYYYLALIEVKKDNLKEAKKLLKKELNLNPNNFEAKKLLNSIKINNNFPYITICSFITILVLFIYINILNYNPPLFEISNINDLIKYSLNSYNFSLNNLILSIFIHINLIHFLFNSLILIIFGLILEKEIGSLKFLLILISGSIIGNYSQILLEPNIFLLGISGGLFSILGYLTATKPFFRIKLFGIINMPIIYILSIYFIFELILNSNIIFETATISHLFGFYWGLFIGTISNQTNIKNFYSWILISFGFYLIYSSSNLLLNTILNDQLSINYIQIIVNLIILLIGILLIIIPFKLLKKISFEIKEKNQDKINS